MESGAFLMKEPDGWKLFIQLVYYPLSGSSVSL